MLTRQKPTTDNISKKAADLVARRPHFSKELESKLLQRGYDHESVLKVIHEFQTKGFINDKDTAELYIEELKRKRHSRYDVIGRLVERGLLKSLADELVQTFFLENDERENIRYLLSKKRFSLNNIEDVKKASDFFIRKGFRSELVRQIIGSKGELDYTED